MAGNALTDPCTYVFEESVRRVILIIYVDDLIVASKDINMLKSIIIKLKKAFKMTNLGTGSNILEIKVQREDETGKICLSQRKYVNELCENFDMRNAKTVPTPIESNVKISKEICPKIEDEKRKMGKRPYKKLVESLIYLVNATRPDIAFAASILSCFCANYEHWLIAKRVLRYLKATLHYAITYVKSNEKLKPYSNSDWAGNIDDHKSRSGNVLFLSGALINWKSIKQASVSLSTMEAEYAALCEVSLEIVYVKQILKHISFEKYVVSPIDVFCDNQSAIE